MLLRFRVWLSQHRVLTLIVLLTGLVWVVQSWSRKPLPSVTRTLGASTQQVEVLWVRQDIFPLIVATPDGTAYAITPARDSLVAFDIRNGATRWEVRLPFEQSDVRGLLADGKAVFVATGLGADAYAGKTGDSMWSTRLGGGHVSVISQLDAGLVRVYYGDKLYELDSGTGKILTAMPKEATIWMSGNIALQALPADKLMALDKQSGEQLWTNGQLFHLDEGQEPQGMGTDILVVGREPAPTANYVRGICALSLRTGAYTWCRAETYLSKMAIDSQSQLGYALRDDFVLVTVDLQTGNVLGETGFLPNTLPEELLHFSQRYSVTISDGVVVVAFSDSGQAFGLSMNQ